MAVLVYGGAIAWEYVAAAAATAALWAGLNATNKDNPFTDPENWDRVRGRRLNPETGEDEIFDRGSGEWKPVNPPPYKPKFDTLASFSGSDIFGSGGTTGATYIGSPSNPSPPSGSPGSPTSSPSPPLFPPYGPGSPPTSPPGGTGGIGNPGGGGAGYPDGPSAPMAPPGSPFGGAAGLMSPLILDLDGDGIETTNLDTGIFFDHDLDGFAERSAWVGHNDGILVFDRNNDGTLNDGTEVFGDHTPLSSGSTAANGFEALSDFDSNLDGKIDQTDTLFSQLKILKGDGNLYTLVELGIKSLNLNYTSTGTTDVNGNIELFESSFEKYDGTIQELSDYNFLRDTTYKLDMNPVEVSADIFELPALAGYGRVYSLHQAMARDTSEILKNLVRSFAIEIDSIKRSQILDQIL